MAVVRNGLAFGSEFEASFYSPLLALQQMNKISGLDTQFKTNIIVNGFKIGGYKWDYVFYKDGIQYLVECKGYMYARDIFRYKAAKASLTTDTTKVLIVWQKPKTKKQKEENAMFYEVLGVNITKRD